MKTHHFILVSHCFLNVSSVECVFHHLLIKILDLTYDFPSIYGHFKSDTHTFTPETENAHSCACTYSHIHSKQRFPFIPQGGPLPPPRAPHCFRPLQVRQKQRSPLHPLPELSIQISQNYGGTSTIF